MNTLSRLSRRKFGQLFLLSSIASLTGIPLVNAATKSGTRSNQFIYGIDVIAGCRRLELKRLDLKTKEVVTLLSPIPDVFVERDELITTFARLDRTSFAIATAPTNFERGSATPTLLTFDYNSSDENASTVLRSTARTVTKPKKARFSKLNDGDKVDGIVKNPQGKLITLSRLADERQILSFDSDLRTSGEEFISKAKLTPAIKNLSQSTEGIMYAVSVEGHGHHAMSTTLWVLNPKLRTAGFQKIQMLSLNGESWGNGLRSLVSTADGKLYGLGAPPDLDRNQLYEIHQNTGKMKRVAAFDVINIAA